MHQSKRVFSWMNPKVEVREAGDKGRGVFANEQIKKNELISVTGGYAMTLEEFDSLPEKVKPYPSQISEEMVFGIKQENEIEDAYYFNHSCEPNIGYGGQIFFRAMRDIVEGEELTFDYGMELFPSKTIAPEEKFSFETMKCDCGCKKCRKIITEYDWQMPELQKKYNGYFSWFIQEKIDILNGCRK